MSAKANPSFLFQVQTVIKALQQQPFVGKTVVLEGTAWKLTDLEAALQSGVDSFATTTAAQISWKSAVAKQKVAKTELTGLVAAIKLYVAATYGKTANMYKTFGFGPQPAKPNVETKLVAVQKTRATRKARRTMGKRQRKSIKGVVDSTPVAPVASSGASASSAATGPSTGGGSTSK